jgi:dihydroorotate dehydrogenase (fumarate)
MADLSTEYLGMRLRTPLVASASPLSESIDNIKRLEDAGASAVVLYSLFEEQLDSGSDVAAHQVSDPAGNPVEVVDLFPSRSYYRTQPEGYLEHLRKAKEAVKIPIIASLNGTSMGGWTEYSKQMQQAGADALELNIYYIPTDIHMAGAQVERTYEEIVEKVRSVVTLPLAVKLGPYFSNMANMAWRVERAGADALVLFNRFYQPDINVEIPEVRPYILLSTPDALRLPLRWIAILHGQLHADLAASGGVHEATDVVKLLMAGANVTMLCSVLLRRGIGYIKLLEGELDRWMDGHEHASVAEIQGTMSQLRSPDPSAFERAHYVRALHGKLLSESARPLGDERPQPKSIFYEITRKRDHEEDAYVDDL